MLVKAITTGGIGALTYFSTNQFDTDQAWQITLSVLIGSVVLVVQFIWEFEKRVESMEMRLARHHESTTRLVQEGFSKISEATELYGLVEESVMHTHEITNLVRNSTRIKGAPDLIFAMAQSEIGRVSRFLKELGDGSMVFYDGEDRDWMLALTRQASRSLDAVSLGMVDAGVEGHGGFWMTDLGRRYLDYQKEAVKRGVRVRRVFVLDRTDDAYGDGQFSRLCALQEQMGIEVRLLNPSMVAGTPQQMFDIILFDGTVSYEVNSAAWLPDHRPTFLTTRLALDPEAIEQRSRHFNALWDSAMPYVPRVDEADRAAEA
ncbi:DUF6879 family protein [Actinocorallia longicatena]|uniref:DUF6879 domain-containing protein n=1 Tax=Actinocorallia longicatena TaxID=111803 RepID=A0ABP6QD92_9ACTN